MRGLKAEHPAAFGKERRGRIATPGIVQLHLPYPTQDISTWSFSQRSYEFIPFAVLAFAIRLPCPAKTQFVAKGKRLRRMDTLATPFSMGWLTRPPTAAKPLAGARRGHISRYDNHARKGNWTSRHDVFFPYAFQGRFMICSPNKGESILSKG